MYLILSSITLDKTINSGKIQIAINPFKPSRQSVKNISMAHLKKNLLKLLIKK